jgi:hypothetical protein
MSLTPKLIEETLIQNGGKKLTKEAQLEAVFAMFDNIFGGDYRIALKDSAFMMVLEDETCPIDAGSMKITDIAAFMSTVQKRRKLFQTYQDYTDTVKTALDAFAEGKMFIDFMRDVKAQGGDIVLQKDTETGDYCFTMYETNFAVPADMPSAELLEIIGDLNLLLKFGLFTGKPFGFNYAPVRYKFEPRKIAGILASDDVPRERVEELLGGIFVTEDFKIDRIALLGDGDAVIDIIEYKNGLNTDDYAKCKTVQKFIVMRADNTKEEFADIIELVITGSVRELMRKRYLGAKAAKIVIPDQLPYYAKPVPAPTKAEFTYLREIARGITDNNRNTRNFYAKDVNSKLYGYGGICSFCRFETDAINGFAVRDFDVELMHDELGTEENFKFSLYLCSTDAVLCDSWIIDDLRVGGMSPFVWLREAADADIIAPALLCCTITYREQVTHDISPTEDDSWNSVMSATKTNSDIILTPLMAANWVEKNTDLVK